MDKKKTAASFSPGLVGEKSTPAVSYETARYPKLQGSGVDFYMPKPSLCSGAGRKSGEASFVVSAAVSEKGKGKGTSYVASAAAKSAGMSISGARRKSEGKTTAFTAAGKQDTGALRKGSKSSEKSAKGTDASSPKVETTYSTNRRSSASSKPHLTKGYLSSSSDSQRQADSPKTSTPGTSNIESPKVGKVNQFIKAIESNQIISAKTTVANEVKGGVELSKAVSTENAASSGAIIAMNTDKSGTNESITLGGGTPQKGTSILGKSRGGSTLTRTASDSMRNKSLENSKTLVRRSKSIDVLTNRPVMTGVRGDRIVRVNKDAKSTNGHVAHRQSTKSSKGSTTGSDRTWNSSVSLSDTSTVGRRPSVHSLDDEVFDTHGSYVRSSSSYSNRKSSSGSATHVYRTSSMRSLNGTDQQEQKQGHESKHPPSTGVTKTGGSTSTGSDMGLDLKQQGVYLPKDQYGILSTVSHEIQSLTSDKLECTSAVKTPGSQTSGKPTPLLQQQSSVQSNQSGPSSPVSNPSSLSTTPLTPLEEPGWPPGPSFSVSSSRGNSSPGTGSTVTSTVMTPYDETFLQSEFEEWAALEREMSDIWGSFEVDSGVGGTTGSGGSGGGGEKTSKGLRRQRKEMYKKKLKAAGIKETYYGFDDDRSSVDSEMSTSSRLSSSHLSLDNTFDEDDMFDEFTREEFLRNYQRLAKEHLELEKSNALLHHQATSHVDPQREQKLRSQLENDLLSAQSRIEDLMKIVHENGQDISWLDEKELLNNNITTLNEKLSGQAGSLNNMKMALQDKEEQNEELEFRCLELEELNKRLREEAKTSLTYTGPVTLSDDGVLELYAQEEGLIDVHLEELKSRLQQLTEVENDHFSKEEQVVLLQTYALLNIADQKLKEHQTQDLELNARLDKLEFESTSLREAGVSKELAETYNETKSKLEEAESKLRDLSEEVEELRKSDAVHKYTEDFNQKAEERYKDEISVLRRQLSTSQEGRDYENELLAGKLQHLKELEQKVAELETENKSLQTAAEESKQRAEALQHRLTMEQATKDLTESEQDTSTLLHNLRTKLGQHEKSEHELSEKNEKLMSDLTTLRERLTEYEQIEAELTEKTFTLQQDVETSQNEKRALEDDLKSTKNELRSYQSQISVGSSRVRASREDLVSMGSLGSVGSMSELDLSEDNQSMRVELFSLREQLKSTEHEVERLRRSAASAGSAGGVDVQWKVKSLEKEMMDLKHENVTLKERLREKMKEVDTIEEELGAGLREKKARIKSLEAELEQSQTESRGLETIIVEMKKELFAMQDKLDVLEGGAKEKDMLKLKASHKELQEAEEMAREELEVKPEKTRDANKDMNNPEKDVNIDEDDEDLQAMTASHAVLKDNAESLLRREEEYDRQITDLHQQLKAKTNQVDDLEVENSHILSELEALRSSVNVSALNTSTDSNTMAAEQEELITQLKEALMAKEKELEARDQLEIQLNEKDNRITFLQEQIERMEESEGKLNKSLTDVEQLEDQLREQLLSKTTETIERTTESSSSGASLKDFELEVTQLRLTEERLLSRIDELEETEKSLKEKLDKNKSLEESDEDEDEPDVESLNPAENSKLQHYKKRVRSLEARVKELAGHESDLMEQIYAMQLENQELQEHIDLLQDASDHEMDDDDADETPKTEKVQKQQQQHMNSVPPSDKPEPSATDKKISELEEANQALKDEVLKAKLDAMEATKTVVDETKKLVEVERFTEMEVKLATLEKREEEFVTQIETLQSLEKKIKQLEVHRSELEAELEEHAQGERKLQQKIEILEQSEEKLMDELDHLTTSERRLKEDLVTMKAASSSGQQELLDKIRKLEDQEHDLRDEITDLQTRRETLTEKLDDARKSETSEVQRLQDKVDILLDTEEKLIDRLQEQDAIEANLKTKLSNREEDMEKLNTELAARLREIEEVKPLVKEAEETIADLNEKLREAGNYSEENANLKDEINAKTKAIIVFESKITELEKDRDQQLDRVKVFEEEIVKLITKLKSLQREVDELNEKLQISETEKKQLLDDLRRLRDVEEAKNSMERANEQYTKQINELEEEITQLYEKTSDKQKEIEQLQDKLTKLELLEKSMSDVELEMSVAARKLADTEDDNQSLKIKLSEVENKVSQYEESEKSMKEMINDLEKAEAVLLSKIDSYEDIQSHLKTNEASLRQQLADYQQNEGSMTARLVTLEKDEVRLQTRVSELESQNTNLMSTINSQAKSESILRRTPSPSHVSPKPRSRSTSPQRAWDDFTHLEKLDAMSREELMSKVHELERMERFHRSRIQELTDNMAQFRQAVETATVTMETDTNIPVGLRAPTKDAEYEAKVAEMVRTEVNLKMRILHLQRQDSLLRSELAAAEDHMHEMEQNFRAEVEELEQELDESRKSEAMWKNKLQYGQVGQENQALSKIEHLENLVFELEGSERKLQREVNLLQESEQRLNDKLRAASQREASALNKPMFDIPVDESDKYFDIIQQVMLLDANGKELSDKITRIERDDTAVLKQRIADLEVSEKGLQRKVELLEHQEPRTKTVTFATLEQGAMDTAENVLKKRVDELEDMEQHMQKQVIELERDREELHELGRNDKRTIHELSVHVRELELSEKNLKDQVNRLEASEGRLSLTIDDLHDRIAEHQTNVQMLQSSEKQLKFALEEQQRGKNELTLQLQNLTEEFTSDEQRLKKRIQDLEGDKQALTERIDELTDRVGDLEGVEISMKSKIKVLENSEMELKSTSLELEHSESEAKSRVLELEAFNDQLSQKLHSIQEEKSNIMFEMSDLQSSKELLEREVKQLKGQLESIRERMSDSERSESDLVKKIEEQAEREIVLVAKVSEYERIETANEQKVNDLEQNEKKLRLTIQQLEASISVLNSRVENSGDMEKENSKLHEELKLARAASITLNGEKQQVQQKLDQYETANSNNDLATLPRAELSTLRAQVNLLADLEKNVAELEKSEKNLKHTVQRLRDGYDACGHEMEIKELKDEVNKLNSTVKERDGLKRVLNTTKKAHELLKENHEATKEQLNQLLNQTRGGNSGKSAKVETSSRATQARLSTTYKLKDVSPELRLALKGLGAKYPDAYQDFVRTLQPSQVVKQQKERAAKERLDAMIIPASSSSLQAPAPGAAAVGSRTSPVTEAPQVSAEEMEKQDAIRELVDQLPIGDVRVVALHASPPSSPGPGETSTSDTDSSLDEAPVAGTDHSMLQSPSAQFSVGVRASSSPRNVGSSPLIARSAYYSPAAAASTSVKPEVDVVEEYVESFDLQTVKTGNINKVSVNSEDPLWATIEGIGATVFSPGTDQEESYWANIENTSNDLDDMTLCLTFAEETDALSRSTSSVQSDASVPPLPTTLPPPISTPQHQHGSSFYLPTGATPGGDDSADEAPEIADDDDDLGFAIVNKRRAKSADRDTSEYYSEALPLGASSQSPQQRRRKTTNKLGAANTSSLDSIPDSGMGTLRQSDADFLRERIALLEKQLKTREKELEVSRINQREANRDAEDAATLHLKITDQERQLDVERRRVADLGGELSEVRSQLGERETDVRRLKADIDRLQHSLKQAPNSTDADSNENYLREQIDRKEKEITAKSNEVDRLIQEMGKLQAESRSAQEERAVALTQLTTAQLELQTQHQGSEQLEQLTAQHQALKQEYDDLVAQHEQLSSAQDEKSALEKIVLKLRGQLKDLERIDLERQTLEEKVKALEEELKLTKDTEAELTRENARMRQQLEQLRKETENMGATHATYTKVIAKYENMEQIKNKAQLMVTPLRAKAIRLAQKCKEKDNLIERLAEELERSGEPSDLLTETDRVKAISATEEYNRPATPLPADIFDDEVAVESSSSQVTSARLRTTSAGSSAGSSGADSLLDDDHGYHDDLKTSKRGRADGKVSKHAHKENGSLTIDDLVVPPSGISLQPVTLLGRSSDVTSAGDTSTWPRKKATSAHVPTPPSPVFRAVKDYDPELFSQSGQKHRELALREGQTVRLLGGQEQNGYCEAEVEGKIGLVPATYLEPVNKESHRKHHTLRAKPVTQNGSPEQILALHSQLQQSHIPQHQVLPPNKAGLNRLNTIVHPAFVRRTAFIPAVQRSTTLPRPRTAKLATNTAPHHRMSAQIPSGIPHPPVHGAPVIHHDGLLMTVPKRRSLPALPQRLPGGLRRGPYGGQSAPPVDARRNVNTATVRAPPDPPSQFRIERVVGDSAVLLTWQPPQMDDLARSNGCEVKGYTIYINNRDKQRIPSPHMPKALVERLNLRRPNRFSIQSVGESGQKSRVVDVLFEDVLPSSGNDENNSHLAAGEEDGHSVSSTSSSQHEEGQRRVFMAVYDYNPTEHSPHDCPSDELSFRTGDLITVYGSANAEGFYTAKLHGRKGLVPASFIEEVSLLRSHSKRSLTGSGSQPGSRPHSRASGSAPNSHPKCRSGSRPNSIHGNIPVKMAATPVL